MSQSNVGHTKTQHKHVAPEGCKPPKAYRAWVRSQSKREHLVEAFGKENTK